MCKCKKHQLRSIEMCASARKKHQLRSTEMCAIARNGIIPTPPHPTPPQMLKFRANPPGRPNMLRSINYVSNFKDINLSAPNQPHQRQKSQKAAGSFRDRDPQAQTIIKHVLSHKPPRALQVFALKELQRSSTTCTTVSNLRAISRTMRC